LGTTTSQKPIITVGTQTVQQRLAGFHLLLLGFRRQKLATYVLSKSIHILTNRLFQGEDSAFDGFARSYVHVDHCLVNINNSLIEVCNHLVDRVVAAFQESIHKSSNVPHQRQQIDAR